MDPNSSHLSEEGRRRFGLVLDFIEIAKPQPRLEGVGKSPMPITQTTSKIETTVPTNNLAVFGFCELCGLIFGLPPGEDLYRGAPVTAHMVAFLAIGGAFAILGPTWPGLKSRFPRRLSATFVRTASDFRWWVIALLAGLIGPALIGSFAQPSPNHVVGYVSDYSGKVVSGLSPSHTPLIPETPSVGTAFPQGASPASSPEGVRPFSAGNVQALQLWMLDLPRPCRVKITAPSENQPLRLWLRDTAINGVGNIGGSSEKIQPCTVVDDDKDMHPDWYGDQTFPEAGFIVHVTPSWGAIGEFLETGLRQIQLKARHGQGLSSDSPYDLYLEIGKGSPWQ
jgi:hypothetical protein